jgi:signal transduction histidine kinase
MLSTGQIPSDSLPVHLLQTRDTKTRIFASKKVNALVVDDSKEDLLLLSNYLANIETLEVDVTPVRSLKEARQMAAAVRFDIVFLDLGLPESNGPETVSKFISYSSNLPIVVITGHDDEETGVESIYRGAQDFICKNNLSVTGLSSAMRHALERHKLYSQMERLLTDNPSPLLIVDCDNITQFMNPVAKRLLGNRAAALMHSEFPANIYTADNSEISFELAEGFTQTIEVIVQPTPWAGSRSFLVSLNDVSLRKQNEANLQAEKYLAEEEVTLKNTFLTNVGNELKSPLNAIIGFSDILLDEDFATLRQDAFNEYVTTIRNNGEALHTQINDLLELSQINADTLILQYAELDLSKLVEKLIDDMRPTAKENRIAIKYTPPENNVIYNGDGQKLRLILRHLLLNALKFTSQDGSVVITVTDRKDEVICLVSDDGCGIHEDEITKVLEPFERGTNPVSQAKHEGAGVGLTLANQLVRLHGGVLDLVSKPDAGTSVILTLPKKQMII